MPTFLPDDALLAIIDLLEGTVRVGAAAVPVETIGAKDFDDDDQLVMQLPAVRVRYEATSYRSVTNNARVYDAEHVYQIWCAAENLRGGADQREDTLALVRQVLTQLTGQRLQFSDGTQSDPVRLLGISSIPDDNIGTVYIIGCAVNGSAQF